MPKPTPERAGLTADARAIAAALRERGHSVPHAHAMEAASRIAGHRSTRAAVASMPEHAGASGPLPAPRSRAEMANATTIYHVTGRMEPGAGATDCPRLVIEIDDEPHALPYIETNENDPPAQGSTLMVRAVPDMVGTGWALERVGRAPGSARIAKSPEHQAMLLRNVLDDTPRKEARSGGLEAFLRSRGASGETARHIAGQAADRGGWATKTVLPAEARAANVEGVVTMDDGMTIVLRGKGGLNRYANILVIPAEMADHTIEDDVRRDAEAVRYQDAQQTDEHVARHRRAMAATARAIVGQTNGEAYAGWASLDDLATYHATKLKRT